MAKAMTTHELARELLALPDVPVYRLEPTRNHWREELAVPVRAVHAAVTDGGRDGVATVRPDGDERPGGERRYVIE